MLISSSLAMQAGWGDEGADVGPLNPHYNADAYQDYSQSTRRNLARVDENRIDFDLLEELVGHIDASYDDGAVLVFLPGKPQLVQAAYTSNWVFLLPAPHARSLCCSAPL